MYSIEANNVFEAISEICKLSTDTMPLLSIQLDKPLQTSLKRSCFIRKGDMVRVEDFGQFGPALVDVTDDLPPTHVILECRGTIYNLNLQVLVCNIETQEELTIKL